MYAPLTCILLSIALTLPGNAWADPPLRSEQDASQQSAPAQEQPSSADATPPTSASGKPKSRPSALTPPKPSSAQAALPKAKRSLPPLRSMITSPFGPRAMPGWLGRGSKPMRMHNGIDIRARIGWPVVAFKDGTVRQAGPHGNLGLAVVIHQNDSMTSYYGHLSKTLVTVGQRVSAGTVVGHVGCTGRTTGAHLHFGLHNGEGVPINPLPFLERAEQLLQPSPNQIPDVLEPQACGGTTVGPVVRGRNGLPTRINRELLRRLDSYTPPPLPTWGSQ